MGEYLRATRECELATMNHELAAAIRAHAERHDLGDLQKGTCCETTSIKQKRGLFGKQEIILTGVLFTSQWLVCATLLAGKPAAVLSGRLRDVQVQDYEKSSMYQMIPDGGLTITGLRSGASEPATLFVGFGPEPVALHFRAALREAVAQA